MVLDNGVAIVLKILLNLAQLCFVDRLAQARQPTFEGGELIHDLRVNQVNVTLVDLSGAGFGQQSRNAQLYCPDVLIKASGEIDLPEILCLLCTICGMVVLELHE